MIEKQLQIVNKLGLHARAAAKLVSLAANFEASVDLEKDGQRVNGKSIMGVMMLAAAQGTDIELVVSGDDAEAALDALDALIADRFGEEE